MLALLIFDGVKCGLSPKSSNDVLARRILLGWTLSRSHVAARLHMASLDLQTNMPTDVASFLPFIYYIVQQTSVNRSVAITFLMVFPITKFRARTDDHRFLMGHVTSWE